MGKMEIWDQVKTPPKEALKQIRGGRLSGMTDIKPQWRNQVMTEVLGPCGFGWKYEIEKLWVEDASDNQKFAFANINLFVFDKKSGMWADPIPANGGSMLIVKEKSGLHSNDEAFKMAITDALGTAMKMIGVASDIHMGYWDGSKYKNPAPLKPKTGLSKSNLEWLKKFCEDHQIITNQEKNDFMAHYGFTTAIPDDQFESIKRDIESEYKEVA